MVFPIYVFSRNSLKETRLGIPASILVLLVTIYGLLF